MKKIHIGVIGSMADSEIEESLKEFAQEIGKEIANNNAILLFGLEGDFESLSLLAAKAAEKAGGQTVAFTWGSDKIHGETLESIQIITGQQRGGGREFSFILSCDVVLALSGGSGTLMEIAMAYQANIPIVVMGASGGWSEKVADTFLDNRKRFKILSAATPKEAVQMAINSVRSRR